MPTGLTKDAGWQIGVSRVLPHDPGTVWDFLTGEGLRVWLGRDELGEVRSLHELRRIRLSHGSTVLQVTVTPTAAGRTTLRFHQEHLADADAREAQREHWTAVMDAVEAALGAETRS